MKGKRREGEGKGEEKGGRTVPPRSVNPGYGLVGDLERPKRLKTAKSPKRCKLVYYNRCRVQ